MYNSYYIYISFLIFNNMCLKYYISENIYICTVFLNLKFRKELNSIYTCFLLQK